MKKISYLFAIVLMSCASVRENNMQQKPDPLTNLPADTVVQLPNNNHRPPAGKRNSISGKWQIAAYYQNYSEQPIDASKKYLVNMDEFAGTINGRVCNSMSGKLNTGAGFDLKVGPLMSTKMMCADMQTENNVFSAFQQANRFSFDQSGLIFYQGEIPLLKLIKISDPE